MEKIRAIFQKNPILSGFLLGCLGWLAFAPFNFYLILIPIFSGLLLLLHPIKSPKRGFWIGLSFGFGYFATGVFWVSVSFSKVGLGHLMPFVVLGFSFLLAIFPALACALTVLWQRNALQQVLLFSALWSATEWTRGHILSGFPWNLVGYALDLPMLQSCAWVGIYGLSLVTIFLATVWVSRSHKVIILSCCLGATLWCSGFYRIKQGQQTLGDTGINMRLVQPSIQQEEKWTAQHLKRNIGIHVALSELEAEKPLKVIIWPEAAIPCFLDRDPELLKAICQTIPEGAVLLTGAPRHEDNAQGMKIWNSFFAFNNRGEVLGVYDKAHLVPFGEYVPFRKILPIEKLTAGTIDYTEGDKVKTLNIPGIPPFSPLICYEAIFSGEVIDPDSKPRWLLNLTNDAWYGHTSGPYQHLSIVRVRAIEEGLPLVRVANNGISAVMDPYGRILYQLELDEIGFIDFCLPQNISDRTVFSSFHQIPFVLMMIIALLGGYLVRNRKKYVCC